MIHLGRRVSGTKTEKMRIMRDVPLCCDWIGDEWKSYVRIKSHDNGNGSQWL